MYTALPGKAKFLFLESFSLMEHMIKKEKFNHYETISIRFLMSKLVNRMISDQFATVSSFGLFFIKGTDDQEREVQSL